jgi:hypothetical protein
MNSQTTYIAHGVYSFHKDTVLKENPINVEILAGKTNIFFVNRSEDTSFILIKGKEIGRIDFADGDYAVNYEATVENKPVVYGILRSSDDVVKLIMIMRGEYYDLYVIVSTLSNL